MEVEYAANDPTPVTFLSSRATSNMRDDALRFGALDVANKASEILDFMKIVEPRLQSLSAVAIGNGTVVHGDLGLGTKMPIYYMGDGAVRILNMILGIATSTNGVLLIDEFGNGLHYSILSRVCEAVAAAAQRYNVQVIATTHSYEFLKEAHKGFSSAKTGFSFIRVDRVDEGHVAKTYDYEMLDLALAQGLEIR
jgi:predicted ATPase